MRTARKIRYRLEWLGLKFATKFLPLLSRKACYRLALLFGSLGAMLDRRGRRVALSNLRVAFGDEISAEGRAQIVRESYQHFARTMLDFFWSPRLTSQNFSRYVEFENREDYLRRLFKPNNNVRLSATEAPFVLRSFATSARSKSDRRSSKRQMDTTELEPRTAQ